ncbi:MAG: hypothetical protein H6745_30940 [Deltaproteobacteria bacterium]|nr:hypothetical protein [Deltaproteobacteria bacterium]
MRAFPGDLATGVSPDGELVVGLFALHGEEPPAEVVAQLAASITARTASGMEVRVIAEAVPRTTPQGEPQAEPYTEEELARIGPHVEVRPLEAWPDGWLTVSMAPLEHLDFRWLGDGRDVDGRPWFRFRR